MSNEEIGKVLLDIKQLLQLNKKMLNIEDFCLYTGFSKQYAYYLTSNGKIRFSRPAGKMIYFEIDDVVEFLQQNPVEATQDLQQRAINNLLNVKRS